MTRAALPALAVLAFTGCMEPVRTSSVETLELPPGSGVEVRLDRGSIEVREHAGPLAQLDVERSAGALSREAAESALDALRIDAGAAPSGRLLVRGRDLGAGAFRLGEQVELQVVLRVPPGTTVDARTGDGRIRLVGLSGVVAAATAEGRIVAESVRAESEPARLRTGSGRIEGHDLAGRFHAESGGGRIELSGRLEEVHAVSARGRVAVEVTRGGGPGPGGVWELRSADGPVLLTLPEGVAARLSAAGDEDGEEEERPDWKRRATVRFAELGEGPGAEIRLRGEDGAEVRLEERGARRRARGTARRP